MKKVSLLLSVFLLVFFVSNVACKKSKDAAPAGETQIETLALESEQSNALNGRKYTFRLRFEKVGNITEYGIVFKAWIKDLSDKTPVLDESSSVKVPFVTSAASAEGILTEEATFPYSYFNDANYRAYAKLSDGSVVYGEILYIVFS